jgi:hypothetical protein
LDLTKIDGNGEFPCPECEATISPDDCTEEGYSILEAKVGNEGLEELVVRCNRCSSVLHLTGFSQLRKFHDVNMDEGRDEKREEILQYIVHI